MKNDFEWNTKNFYTAKELESYIKPIRKSLVGKALDKIMIIGHIYTSAGLDDNENRCVKYADEDNWFIAEHRYENQTQSKPTSKVSLSLDEPLVLCFGDKHFEIKYCEFSNAQIGMNILTSKENSVCKDVSHYFAKNIIGQKLLDIKIKHTNLPNEYVSHYRKIGEYMYDEIVFVFENGYQLEISSDIDYMSLSEKPIWFKQQQLAKRDWDFYYDSKMNLEDNEKTFKELISESTSKNGDNMIISGNKI